MTSLSDSMIDTYDINSLPIYEISDKLKFKLLIDQNENKNKQKHWSLQIDKYKKEKFEVIILPKQLKSINSKKEYESLSVKNNIKIQPKEIIAHCCVLINLNNYYDVSEHNSHNEYHCINQNLI